MKFTNKKEMLLDRKGSFFIGCNYWASRTGTHMWRNWDVNIVETDLERLSKAGIQVLRIFPLWTDFQPINLLRQGFGEPAEYRMGELPLTDDEEGLAGINKEVVGHFSEFIGLAGKYGLKLVVGLVTGWMSGRLFVPPALEGLDILTDPVAIMWQVRFVKYMVRRFKSEEAIIAWDLGNECNCMGKVTSRAQAWNWTCAIADAIRSEDTTRPVVSGMHSLQTEGNGNWLITDQAELTDILTTHPYTSPTYGSDTDPANTIQPLLHPVANTLFYKDIGGKPCFVEETGTFGPMCLSDDISADYARCNLFNLWAHDCRGYMWWCANDFSDVDFAPYDWFMMERELGLFRHDGTKRPVLEEMGAFMELINKFPYGILPGRIIDAVCILPNVKETWPLAYSSFILAKQAGLDIEYQYADQKLKDSGLYLLPGTSGVFGKGIKHSRMKAILEKVIDGSILYISTDGACFDSFESYSGVRVQTRERSMAADKVKLMTESGPYELPLAGTYKLHVQAVNADILASEEDGNPAMTCAKYGKGYIVFLRYPLERYIHGKPGLFCKSGAIPYWRLYRVLKNLLNKVRADTGKGAGTGGIGYGGCRRIADKDNPMVSMTEHIIDRQRRVLVLVNNMPETAYVTIRLEDKWKLEKSLYNKGTINLESRDGYISVGISKNNASVLTIYNITLP